MWSRTVFLFSYISCCLSLGDEKTEVFDVTTIFNVGQLTEGSSRSTGVVGRVHSRTNALGLPLFNGDARLEKIQMPNVTCDSIEEVCAWTLKGWTLVPSITTSKSNVGQGQFYPLTDPSTILMKGILSRKNDDIFLYLSSGSSISNCTAYYEIKVSYLVGNTQRISYRECSCDITSETDYNRRGRILVFGYYEIVKTVNCREYQTITLPTKSFNINFEQRHFRVFSDSKQLHQWSDSVDVKYIHVKDDYSKAMQLLVSTKSGKSYVSTTKDSEMVSPVINLEGKQMCLAVVFHVPSYVEESVLDILAEDLSITRYQLYAIKNVTAGWNTRNVNINLSGRKTAPFKLILKKSNATEVKVARISSCDPDGQEVKILPPTRVTYDNLAYKVPPEMLYTATAHAIEPAEVLPNGTPPCLNGGVWTSAGCACPPGFYGSACQSGCGRNRYGQDCGGLCSVYEQECEGLLLCTQLTGCHCAPGYHGQNCRQKCSVGWYGNDCRHECGHCAADSHCDIYTGECVRCEFGYLSPNCQNESVYYSSEPQLSSSEYGEITVSFEPKLYKGISGPPRLYQIQYTEKDGVWKTHVNKKYQDVDVISEKIAGLKSGILYQVRVLLMDASYNKYDGELVGVSEIITSCEVPETYDYKVKYGSNATSLKFSWIYVNNSIHWCPVKTYEVFYKEDWKWVTIYTADNCFSLENLLPGSTIKFKVRTNTSGGFAPYSETVVASTQHDTGFARVRNLRVESSQSSSIDLSWEAPMGTENQQLRYTISYKCLDRLACSPGCQNTSEGQQHVQGTSMTLSPLLPLTQYLVTVTPENGQQASIFVGTLEVVPTEVPTVSAKRPERTNTSMTVFWEQGLVCSGYLLGYNYQLTKASDDFKILDSGFTRDTSATFHNLTASTQYIVKVFVSTFAGWNPEHFLVINVSTSATVPEVVRNLTVYKSGRGMLGLRWSDPRATYGQLKSFTVSHTLGQEVTSHTVEPTHCVVWPDLYCHTIEGLRSNRRYNVSVSARNADVAEDGEAVFVNAITKESPPSAPVNLKVVNRTSTTLEIQWNYPELANGIVRSFLISVEETEKYDQESCCQIYPLVETSVKEELETFSSEVSGLHPASTYFVSVSAKTVGLGPSQSLVVNTRPPHLPFEVLPRVEIPSLEEISWLPQEKLPEVNNSEVYTPLIKTRLLLAVVNETQSVQVAEHSGMTDPNLDRLLKQLIGTPFYFISEYNQEDIVSVGEPLEQLESEWGRAPASLPGLFRYQLVAAQILEYNGVYNVDLRFSQPITLAY